MVCTLVKPDTCLYVAIVLSEFPQTAGGTVSAGMRGSWRVFSNFSGLHLLLMVLRTLSLSSVPR